MKTTEKTPEVPTIKPRTQNVTVTLKGGGTESLEVIGSVQNGDGLTLTLADKTERKFSASEIKAINTENP